jgi:hypothetical protein
LPDICGGEGGEKGRGKKGQPRRARTVLGGLYAVLQQARETDELKRR